LGRRMVDDIKNRFCNSTDLFLLQSFPLQLEASDSEDDVQWNNNIGVQAFYMLIGQFHFKLFT
ncbi:hypothetical protein MKZ49_23135, partial [Pseudoalteromonas shioyasakiensis]|uniref:hypothetical protein n=1 Tax=Pseudoalteromonas shioyasakiensis TaxID=1190813 RepID=UPI0024A67CC6